jgi:hypothetical protein
LAADQGGALGAVGGTDQRSVEQFPVTRSFAASRGESSLVTDPLPGLAGVSLDDPDTGLEPLRRGFSSVQ